ncbi:MAG: lipocalin family protein [Candidatus Cloacimonetes bacterium]|nr:lipocalin family protein [Candidatus Cloacimonadota bacterium]
MFALAVVFFAASLISVSLYAKEMKTVERVDLGRYIGLWYETARIPNTFQKKCTSDVTAEYGILDNGNIQVTNRCVSKSGKVVEAVGIAKVVDTQTNAKLKVSFVNLLGAQLFWGNYWIIGLDPDYKWAIVGEPSLKYGWILSRTKVIEETELTKIFGVLSEKGYDPSEFVMTKQVIGD